MFHLVAGDGIAPFVPFGPGYEPGEPLLLYSRVGHPQADLNCYLKLERLESETVRRWGQRKGNTKSITNRKPKRRNNMNEQESTADFSCYPVGLDGLEPS